MPRGTGMAPTRRRNRLGVADPEALAAQLPEGLRAWKPSPGSQGFSAHARRIAEWLNTQQAGLGYLTPLVMAAAGLTAAAWFRQSLAIEPPPHLLDGPAVGRAPGSAPRVLPIPTAPETPESGPAAPTTWVYDPALTVPPRPRLGSFVVDPE